MPSTLFHIPPAVVVGFPLRRHVDLPAFLLANLTIDVEPGIAMLLDLGPPPHGYAHTLLGGAVVGALTGWLLWRGRHALGRMLRGEYPQTRRAAVLSGVAGCWLHVLLDAVMYDYLRPFFPWAANPLYIAGSGPALHVLTGLLVLPAAALVVRYRYWRTAPQRLTSILLAVSAVGVAAVAIAEVL